MILGTLEKFITPAGSFVFTLTSNGYKMLTLNLVRQLQAIKVPWTLCIICADKDSYLFFSREGIPCRRVEMPLANFGAQVSPFGSKQFQTLNRMKLALLSECIENPAIKVGIYLDGDIAVYRDFLPDIEERLASGPRVLFQCDEKGREECVQPCANFCTGFVAWRGGASAEPFTVRAADREVWEKTPEDQVFVNTKMRVLGCSFGTLPRMVYPNGMFASLTGIKDAAFLLHYNYLVGAMKQKKMKANGDWVIPY